MADRNPDVLHTMHMIYAQRLSRRKLLQVASATTGAAVLGGPLAGSPGSAPMRAMAQEEPKQGGTFIYAMESEADILDPQGASG